MKKLILKLVAISLLAFYFLACDDDDLNDPFESIPTIQFKVPFDSLKENEGEKTIILSFSQPFKYDATIRVLVDTSKVKHFTSTPVAVSGVITLNVKKNDPQASIKLKPKDDSTYSGAKQIEFKLTRLHNEFVLGAIDKFKLKIVENDASSGSEESELNFVSPNEKIIENGSAWHEVKIHVNDFNTASGTAIIEANSTNAVYGADYISEPAFVDNKITLTANASQMLIFKVKAVNNNQLNGHKTVTFAIRETTGNLVIGSGHTDTLSVTDDELSGLPKGYDARGGTWRIKKTYEYDEKARISKVNWETYTPNKKTGTETYHYNQWDQLTRINTRPGHDILYSYVDARIFLAQRIENGVLEGYTNFDYDEHARLAGYQIFDGRPDGTFLNTSIVVLLYYPTGNLYKKLVYMPATSAEEEPVLSTTETFDSYVNKENPFPMIDVLPNVKTQKTLPTSYRFEGHGRDLQYYFSYEFTQDGKVSKRTVSGPGPSESATYEYY